MRMMARLQNFLQHRHGPEILAGLGALVYAVQGWAYAHSQLSVLDEGGYLFIGRLFAAGEHRPFADYGPWNNQMPLAFLIPGLAQLLLGAGLRSGRLFALFLGLLMLAGLWLAARRLGGRGWAAAAVWAVALNPALVKMYSQAVSQGIVAGLLAWTLALTLGRDRSPRSLIIGGLLAGALVMTRINLLPVLVLLALYLLWLRGRRAALAALLPGLAVIFGLHALYWPGILRIYAYWLPLDIFPFLAPWAVPEGAVDIWYSATTPQAQLTTVFFALRYHFVAIAAGLGTWLFWPRRGAEPQRLKTGVFLSVLFLVLAVTHAFVTLGGSYCVYCFTSYFSFFNMLGILVLVATLPDWRVGRASGGLLASLVALLLGAVALGNLRPYGALAVPDPWVRRTLFWELPRFSGLRPQAGVIPVWGLLENRFGWTYAEMFGLLQRGLTLGLLVLGMAVLAGLLLWLARRAAGGFARLLPPAADQPAARFLLLFLLAAGLLSPSPLLSGGYRDYDCGGNIIANYEQVGAELAALIPPGAQIYWQGGRSPVPLLYLPERGVYWPQLAGVYTYKAAGEPDALLRWGFWSEEVAAGWLAEADYLLLEEEFVTSDAPFNRWLNENYPAYGFTLLAATSATADCRPDSEILVFHKQP